MGRREERRMGEETSEGARSSLFVRRLSMVATLTSFVTT